MVGHVPQCRALDRPTACVGHRGCMLPQPVQDEAEPVRGHQVCSLRGPISSACGIVRLPAGRIGRAIDHRRPCLQRRERGRQDRVGQACREAHPGAVQQSNRVLWPRAADHRCALRCPAARVRSASTTRSCSAAFTSTLSSSLCFYVLSSSRSLNFLSDRVAICLHSSPLPRALVFLLARTDP